MATTEDRDIPEEVILDEILTRLPVKSLLRLQSVSKPWHSTISNCEFIKSHRRHSQSEVHVVHLCEDIPHGVESINIEILTQDGHLQHYRSMPGLQKSHHLINSSHDLVVLQYSGGYLLSNPAKQESVYLRHSPSCYDGVFPAVVGFGFVPSLGKYKVVSIGYPRTPDRCQVFTVGMDSLWRIGKPPPFSISCDGHTPYVSGNLHKLTQNDEDENRKLLVFNLEKETWTVMPLPDHHRIPGFSIKSWHTELREIQGLLCFTCSMKYKGITIWMLRDYCNEGWSKEYVIEMTIPGVMRMPDGLKFWIKRLYGLFPLKVMTDGRILLQMDSLIVDRLFYYDPRDGSIQVADHKGSHITLYAENLVPISGF